MLLGPSELRFCIVLIHNQKLFEFEQQLAFAFLWQIIAFSESIYLFKFVSNCVTNSFRMNPKIIENFVLTLY